MYTPLSAYEFSGKCPVLVNFPLLPDIFRLVLNTVKVKCIQLMNAFLHKRTCVNGKKRTVFLYVRSAVLDQSTHVARQMPDN